MSFRNRVIGNWKKRRGTDLHPHFPTVQKANQIRLVHFFGDKT